MFAVSSYVDSRFNGCVFHYADGRPHSVWLSVPFLVPVRVLHSPQCDLSLEALTIAAPFPLANRLESSAVAFYLQIYVT